MFTPQNGESASLVKRIFNLKYRTLIVLLILVLALIPAVSASTSTIPTFAIQSVVAGQSVTIRTSNFPAGQTFTARMGKIGTRAINGIIVGTTQSGSGGTFSATYTIPEQLKNDYQVAIRLDSPQGYFSYNWFYNNTSGSSPTTPSDPATPGYSGTPTFTVCGVVRNQIVTIRTNDFPANQTFTVTMGAMGTRGAGGTVVGTLNSGAGGTLTATYNIPAALQGNYQIAIRAQTGGVDPYFSYNWFYNTTASVCS